MFPMLADIYYPVVEQAAYGNLKKQWVLDRTVACYLSSGTGKTKEEIVTNVKIDKEIVLTGRVKFDLRISTQQERHSMTNILITNVRIPSSETIYMETSGPRSGQGTIYEVASQEPLVGPTNNVDFYKVLLRRSENQAVDV
jgi:hypothetical protein